MRTFLLFRRSGGQSVRKGGRRKCPYSMTMNNPYIENLVSMGYDRQDVTVTSTMFQKKTFPCVIHGRQFDTEEQYNEELHEFLNGM